MGAVSRPVKIEDFAAIADGGKRLERVAADAFREAQAAILGQKIAPQIPGVVFTPPPETEMPPAPSYGFQEPAPPDAPKLEAENVRPEDAQATLLEYIAVLRRFAVQMHNVSRFSDAIADLLEHGTVQAKEHSVGP